MPNTASFNDGKRAARHSVEIKIEALALIISDDAGHVITRWPLDDIRYANATRRTPPIRLRCDGNDTRLNLDSDDDGAWLTHKCPNISKRDAGQIKWPTWVAAGIFAIASVAGIFVFFLPAIASTIVNLIPYSMEQKLGLQSRDQLIGLAGHLNKNDKSLVCTSPIAQAILDKRAKELATLMDSPFPITMTVLRVPITNALALPGGQVIILSGLLDHAKSGDEVIGVLAHEIAHVVRRDPMQVSIKQTGAALLVSLLIGDVFGGAALSGIASSVIESGYSRDAEAASDFLGVTALNQLGLTARPLADFMGRISQADPISDIIPDFLNTHPAGNDRRDAIIALSQENGRAMSGYAWKALKSMCEK